MFRTAALVNASAASSTKNLATDVPTLCAWPPSYKYYCWLDVTNNVETEILPLYDNCAGSFPLVKQGPETFTCTDTDPRTQDGAPRAAAALSHPLRNTFLVHEVPPPRVPAASRCSAL